MNISAAKPWNSGFSKYVCRRLTVNKNKIKFLNISNVGELIPSLPSVEIPFARSREPADVAANPF